MWSPSLVRLDLSRRRVAAISFLSNIQADGEPEDIRLDCLKGTRVLHDFQRRKYQRMRWQERRTIGYRASEKGSRKLRNSLEKNVSLKSNKGESKPSLENGQTNFVIDYETDEDIEKAEMDFLNRSRFVGSEVLTSATDHRKKRASRKRVSALRTDDMEVLKTNPQDCADSFPLGLVTVQRVPRFRKVSGTCSENSSSSVKEIRFLPGFPGAGDRVLSGDERLVFVSAQKKIPFAISSVLPYQKPAHSAGKVQHRGDHSLMRRHGTTGSQGHPLTETGPVTSDSKPDIMKFDESQVNTSHTLSHYLHPNVGQTSEMNGPLTNRTKADFF